MTTVRNQLLKMLETVAEALGEDLRERMVFVGGCTTALFITDDITLEDVRATDDVDLIIDLSGYAEWVNLQEQLHGNGFTMSPQDEVNCRMRLGDLKVDFMPDRPEILGFSNRWYAKGIETANIHALTDDLKIKVLTPDLFVATKLESYLGRGQNDLLQSRDMEDILLLLDGREELIAEIENTSTDIRDFIMEQFRAIQNNYDFDYFLSGNIRGPEGRVDIVRRRFAAISNRGSGN